MAIFLYFRSKNYGVYAIHPKRDYLPAKKRVLIDCLIANAEAKGESAYDTWTHQER